MSVCPVNKLILPTLLAQRLRSEDSALCDVTKGTCSAFVPPSGTPLRPPCCKSCSRGAEIKLFFCWCL